MKQVPALTACRALFAAWVFFYHVDLQCHFTAVIGPPAVLIHDGALGVDGFFILSGLVLALSHPAMVSPWQNAWAGSGRFLMKRLLRIYPVHLAIMLLFVLLIGGAALHGQHPQQPERFGLGEMWRHLLLLHAWGASDRWAWNYPSWSVSAEWAGYLMFPLIWPVLRRRGTVAVTVVLAACTTAMVVTQAIKVPLALTLTYDGGLLRFFPDFIAGMTIVTLAPTVPAWLRGWAVTAIGVLAIGAGAFAPSDALVIAGLWLTLAGMLVSARQGRDNILGRVPGLCWLGGVSYAFYMSFAFVETVQATLWRTLHAAPEAHRLLYIVTTTALTMALGVAVQIVVERPAMRLVGKGKHFFFEKKKQKTFLYLRSFWSFFQKGLLTLKRGPI